ncbi:aldose 1-epimerase family protein [Knoellia subterranea]|uniref:Galactose mutarotase n=1 Tax=Knoellia subterranea KCTC 19937 TaxID=1385521 RepID=A0A0A0JHP3_9MICO|nr:aldose 1-epimerase family protein [Knoellia subterranea]KGN36643.1 galactose mutarotase [Knoellia subterranea KCTC 19937]
MSSRETSPTGTQWSVSSGPDEFTVVEVGGGLRAWNRAGVDVLAGYSADSPCTSGRGQQLIPWPNRIRDGRYAFDGAERQLPLTEVEHHNASHGLVRWAPWRLVDRTDTSITVGHRLFPQPGWDWHLETTTMYAVTPEGLTVTTRVANVGEKPAPFGYGAHPYVAIGDAPVEEVEVQIPAECFVEVDDRLLPTRTTSVEGSVFDFRERKAIGAQRLDTAYTDLSVVDGRWTITVATPGRAQVEVWGEAAAFPWAQVFSGKAEADQSGEHGIAVEPMTCPADAFNSGDSLVVLEPGQTWQGVWGISPR